ncbi:MAG TPA: bifunctional RNase H/acid phosphatase [Pilimelia sp.]|nr:bifunctional RNase H/acid phosphatase [Pilimelia sp.]
MGRRLRVIVEADGGARGNPGPAGYGAVVRDADTGEILAERSAAIGVATNNVAEYLGLVAGLEAAAELGAAEVEMRMDSKLVIEQMSGRWQIKHPGLRPLAAQAAALIRKFDRVNLEWVPRARNAHADALANAAMDAAAGEPPREARPKAEATPAAEAAPPPLGSWAPPASPATRLIMVRHGETELTAQRRYSGRGDVPLTPVGLAQAGATAVRVASLAPSVSAVVTSPLGRCTRTAELIAASVGGVPVRVEPDLIECDFGAWEGLTFAEVSQRWSDEQAAWLASTRVAPPGGESFEEVDARVRRAVAGWREQVPAGTIVVVSHVTPIKLILRDALAAGDTLLYRLYLDPGGLSIVDMWPDGGVAVRTVNETAHLPRPDRAV